DRSLPADEHGDPDGEPLPERLAAAERDPEAGVREQRERRDHGHDADEAELLADDGEDHVGVRLRQVEHLLDAVAEAATEDAARRHADHRLDDLEAGVLRVAPRVEEGEDAIATVRLE